MLLRAKIALDGLGHHLTQTFLTNIPPFLDFVLAKEETSI
jgi:hypothetical protein